MHELADAEVTYEVLAVVDAALVEEYVRFMRDVHVPEVMATGCFREASFESAAPGHYRTRYVASSAAALDRYLERHTAGLRADFERRFPAGVTLSRAIWTSLRRFP